MFMLTCLSYISALFLNCMIRRTLCFSLLALFLTLVTVKVVKSLSVCPPSFDAMQHACFHVKLCCVVCLLFSRPRVVTYVGDVDGDVVLEVWYCGL